MSLDLLNLDKLISQTSNKNVLQNNMLKLQQFTKSLTDERQKVMREKAEMRRLKKQMNDEKQKLLTERSSLKNQLQMAQHKMQKSKSMQLNINSAALQQRKSQRNLTKKLDEMSKELTTVKRKLMSEQFRTQNVQNLHFTYLCSNIHRRKGNGDKDKKFKALQKRYNAEQKGSKKLKRTIGSLEAELTLTRRKLLSAQRKNGKGKSGNDQYKRKWIKERKKLKLATLEFNDRANQYRRQLAAFRKKQAKWLRQQKNMMKGRKEAVKYVFIDDMVSIKLNNKYKDRIKIVTRKGKEILVNNVKVIQSKSSKKKKGNKGKKSGKKNEKTKDDFMDDDVTWMEQDEVVRDLLDEIDKDSGFDAEFFSFSQDNEDKKEGDSDDDFDDELDNLEVIRGDVMDWKKEMDHRKEDLDILMNIALKKNEQNDATNDALNFDDLMDGIMERYNQKFEELVTETDESNNSDDNDRKNAYDESIKLLKGDCDEYVNKIQKATNDLTQFIEESKKDERPRASFIHRKSTRMNSLQMSNSQSMTLFTPQIIISDSTESNVTIKEHPTPKDNGSAIDVNLLAGQWENENVSMQNPDIVADELTDFYINEMDSRCKDLQNMHQIFYSSFSNEDKNKLLKLEEIIKNIDERIDDIEDDDMRMVKFINNMSDWKLQFQEYVLREALLLRELNERRDEVEQIFNVLDISGSMNKALYNRLVSLNENIDHRHVKRQVLIDSTRYENILGEQPNDNAVENDDFVNVDDKAEAESGHYEEYMDVVSNCPGFNKENDLYRELMHRLQSEADDNSSDAKAWKSSKSSVDAPSSKLIENCVKRTMDEMESRTGDIVQLKQVLLSKDSETAGELLNAMEDRQMKLNNTNGDIIKSNANCIEYCVSEESNHSFWRAVQDIVLNGTIMKKHKSHFIHKSADYESSSLSLMMPHTPMSPKADLERQETLKGIEYNENLKFVLSAGPTLTENTPIVDANDENIEFEDDSDESWWLMLDNKRNKLIETFDVTTSQINTLSKLSTFVSRILLKQAKSDKITQLYIPIDLNAYPSQQLRALSTFFDGVIIAKLLCMVDTDCIDLRAIHQPKLDKPYPLKMHEVNQNVSVILSALKSMGIVLDKIYTVKDWTSSMRHSRLLINLLSEFASRSLDRFCSFKNHKELIVLKKKTEPISILSSFDGEKWIIRWINFMLKRNGRDNVNITNQELIRFNKDFMKIMSLLKKRSSVLLNQPNATKSDHSKAFIKVAKTSFNVDTCIEPDDFTNNNRYCQNYFAAQIFDKINGLKMPEEYAQNANNIEIDDGFDEGERTEIMAWLNSFGLRNKIDSMEDISSGVILLQVLDRLSSVTLSFFFFGFA